MKTIKLNGLEKENLTKKEMNNLKGGNSCGCGCHGPSGIEANRWANYDLNIYPSDAIVEQIDNLPPAIIIADKPNNP